MKILHVSTYDRGGAANACLRLHNGLRIVGVDSKVLLKHRTRHIEATYAYKPEGYSWRRKVKDKLVRIGQELGVLSWVPPHEQRAFALAKHRQNLEMVSFPFADTDITKTSLYKDADIIHLHWVAGFLDWKSFFHKNTKPVVWTLHDENPFLGIEHYAERFQGMDQYGKPIQRQYAADEWQEEQKMRHYKRKVLAHLNSPLVIVCPSLWLMGESKKSEILGKYEHHHIPYGFPTHIFSPLRKDFCREVLGLPKDKKLVLFVADSLTNARKGLAFLKQAVQEMQSPDCCFCVVGKCNSDIKSAFGNIIALGEIGDERLMAVAYSAADLFVIPSLEDNLPNTMIEALLCGTPVVGFPTGGIPEVIKNDYNGWICPEVSVASLKKNIQEALKKLDSLNREHIATDAKKQFSLERQAEAYRQLYEELMSKF